MEKISRIVRGNSRVAAVDLKSAAPIRPGAPSFGRPVGESTALKSSMMSTADRAVAIHKELNEAKLANTHETIVQNMADRFFMDRMRQSQSDEGVSSEIPRVELSPPSEVQVSPIEEEGQEASQEIDLAASSYSYTPRGSFIDVRA